MNETKQLCNFTSHFLLAAIEQHNWIPSAAHLHQDKMPNASQTFFCLKYVQQRHTKTGFNTARRINPEDKNWLKESQHTKI